MLVAVADVDSTDELEELCFLVVDSDEVHSLDSDEDEEGVVSGGGGLHVLVSLVDVSGGGVQVLVSLVEVEVGPPPLPSLYHQFA